jgi:PAS domain S-box-containing protein
MDPSTIPRSGECQMNFAARWNRIDLSMRSPEFRALLDAAPDAMVIIDRAGSITDVNGQAETLFGYARDELVAQPIEALIPERFHRSHPGHRAGYFDEPRPRPMGAQGVELYGRRKDGSEFPAEVSLSPMHIGDDRLVIAAIRDGTERRRGEERFRRLLEAAPDAMVIVNADGVMTLVNAQTERLFGYPRERLLGRPVEVLIPERYRAAHPWHRSAYFGEPRSRPMGHGGLALFGLRADGSEFPVEVSLSPMLTAEGTLAIAAVRDISDRVRLEQERTKLVQANEAIRMRDEFLSIVSHELKTPLSALQMQVESILRSAAKHPLPGRIVDKVSSTLAAIDRLSKLVNQLLDLSRITAGRLRLERVEVDLAAVVRGVLTAFQDELETAGCELRLHTDGPVIGIWDPLRIEQIVTNLLGNAIKYGAGKPIEVTVGQTPAGTALFTVRDHGIGVAPEDQERMFERFERAVSERNYGGFGLGLWIVRQIIEAHGGAIRVWSERGAGATFTVELPLGREVVDAPAPPAVVAPAERCVMLVDDDAMIRETFAEVLEDEGYEVKKAADGAEALRLLRSGARPRVIFLDLMMPVMDGPTFRAEQMKDPVFASVPVVVMSAAGNAPERAAAIGASELMSKPVRYETLVALAERFCG